MKDNQLLPAHTVIDNTASARDRIRISLKLSINLDGNDFFHWSQSPADLTAQEWCRADVIVACLSICKGIGASLRVDLESTASLFICPHEGALPSGQRTLTLDSRSLELARVSDLSVNGTINGDCLLIAVASDEAVATALLLNVASA